MTSPTRSVIVRLAMEPSSYIAGASRSAAATTALNREVAKVGATSATSMERAAASTAKAERSFGGLNKAAGTLGLTLGGLVGVGGAVAAALSIKSAADFQQNLTKLTTTAGESVKNIGMVGNGLLDMSAKVGISANDLAKGMYTVESGGFHGAAGLKVMTAAAQGAIQEQADLGKVTDAVTTILHDYHLPASDAAKVTSQLVTAVSHGKTTFDELTGSLHSVTPLAAKLHLSLADVTGTLAAMTASGESADQATQNMADTLRHLATPTSTMIAELSQLGISTDDLQKSLDQRGLAGTLQMVETAIVDHVDPATKRVLLPALNQSKSAAQDLQIMIGKMPPALAKLSQGLLNGSVSFSDYRKSVRDTGGQTEAMGAQFLSLMQSSQGFNNVLKAGGPAAQVFTSAMAKSTGTASGLNVMLQTTGENAAATNTAIKDIAGSSAQADGNIKGWSEVQKNFNQQMREAEQSVGALAIQFGQHLLPVLTSTLGYVNRDVVPGIEHMGSAAGSVFHWFGQLPGPIKQTALAFGVLKVASAINFLGINTGLARMAAGFRGVSAAVAEETAMARWATTVNGLTGATATAEAGISRVAVASGLASRAMTGMRAAGGGLVSFLGGPWGVALIGATLGVFALESAIQKHDDAIKKATQDVLAWNKAVTFGGSGQTAVQAAQHLDTLRGKIAALRQEISAENAEAAKGQRNYNMGMLKSQLGDLTTELDKGTTSWKRQLAAMTPVEEAQTRVDIATKDLNDALKHNPANSQAVTNASIRLHDAQAALAGETERTNRAEKTQIQNLQDQANAALGTLDAQRAAKMSQLQLADAIDQYNADAKDGQHSSRQLQEEQLGLVDSAEQAAKSAGDAAAAQAKQNGATDTGTAYQGAYIKTLQEAADKLNGPAKQAILDQIKVLGKQATQAQVTAGQISTLGVTVTDLPAGHLIKIDAPTGPQMKALHDLGYETVTLPDGKVVITVDTHPAQAEIQDLLNYARQQSINYRATLPDLNGSASGSGRMGTYAAGGWTGPGAKYTPVGLVHADEFVFTKEQTAKAGGPSAMYALATALDRGFASGGWTGLSRDGTWPVGNATIPVHVQDAGYKAGIHSALASVAASAASVGSGVARWTGIVEQVVRMLGLPSSAVAGILGIIQAESGGNPNAINLTDSNARAGHPSQGLMQTIPSTFYRWAGPFAGRGITDPLANIYAGANYALHTYGAGMLEGGGRHSGGRYIGYKTGTDYVPSDGLAYLHKGEAVVPAEKNVRSREVSGGGYPGGAATRPANVMVEARVFIGDREITDIARVEARGAVDGRLQDWDRQRRFH